MPKVVKRKARKDYPAQGIAKGEEYFYWKIKLARGGMVRRSKTYPKPSQLNLGFAGQAGDLGESIDAADSVDGLRSVAEEIRSLGEEQQEKFDNMPDGLQQGDTGQLLEERANQCEEWASGIDQACDEYDSKLEELQTLKEAWESFDNGEGEEPDEERPDDTAEDDLFTELKEECGSTCPF